MKLVSYFHHNAPNNFTFTAHLENRAFYQNNNSLVIAVRSSSYSRLPKAILHIRLCFVDIILPSDNFATDAIAGNPLKW
jgi:hypothetical protein